jgi:hypothetical protein
MNITCYIRRTKLWAERYEHSGEWISTWRADHVAACWDSVFNVTYADFRRRLHGIQVENLGDVGFDAVLSQYEYEPSGGIFVPTDDDDWFHPELLDYLRGSAPGPVIYWNFANFTEGRVVIQNPALEEIKFDFESNNYALRSPQDERLLKDHTHADRKLRNTGLHVDANYSVHNRTMASLGLLKERFDRSEDHKGALIELYEQCRTDPVIDPLLPPYFMNYIDRVQELYKELRIRKML